jgi:hypothetical protein
MSKFKEKIAAAKSWSREHSSEIIGTSVVTGVIGFYAFLVAVAYKADKAEYERLVAEEDAYLAELNRTATWVADKTEEGKFVVRSEQGVIMSFDSNPEFYRPEGM